MSGLGLLGAVGGLGGSFVNQAANIQRNEDRDAEYSRQQTFQDWLMQQREQYAIRAEGRATAAADAQWQKDRDRAPIMRDEKAADQKSMDMAKYDPELQKLARDANIEAKKSELDFTTNNIGQIASNKHAEAEAGVTSVQRQAASTASGHLALAQAEARHKREDDPFYKVPGAVKSMAASYDKTIDRVDTAITKGMADGSLTPDGQKELLKMRAKAQAGRDELLSPYIRGAKAGDGGGAGGLPGMDAVAVAGSTKPAASAQPATAPAAAPASAPSKPVATAPVEQADPLMTRRSDLVRQATQLRDSMSLKAMAAMSPAEKASRKQKYDATMAEIGSIDQQLDAQYEQAGASFGKPTRGGLISTASR